MHIYYFIYQNFIKFYQNVRKFSTNIDDWNIHNEWVFQLVSAMSNVMSLTTIRDNKKWNSDSVIFDEMTIYLLAFLMISENDW